MRKELLNQLTKEGIYRMAYRKEYMEVLSLRSSTGRTEEATDLEGGYRGSSTTKVFLSTV